MRCYKCGQTIDDTAVFCRFCGTEQGSGATTVLDGSNNPFLSPAEMELDPPTAVLPESQSAPAVDYSNNWTPYQPEPKPVYQPEPQPVYQPEPKPVYQPEPQPVFQPAYQPAYQPSYNSAPVYTDQGVGSRPRIQLPTTRSLVKMIFLPLITFGIYGIVIMSKIVTELNIAASRHDGRRTMPYFAMTMLAGITLGIYPIIWIHGFCNRIGDELRRRNINYEFSAATYWLWSWLGSLIIVGPFIYTHKLMKAMNLINADFNERG